MSYKKIVIVVGAGASKEVKLPLGTELKDYIATNLDILTAQGDLKKSHISIYKALRLTCSTDGSKTFEGYLNAANIIREAMPLAESIDNFIHNHRTDRRIVLCGKLAIVKSILAAEKESALNFSKGNIPARFNPRTTQDTWLNLFFKMITNDCQAEELIDRLSSITLVVFNYDRCIEHFLYHSIQISYPTIDQEQATKIIRGIKMYHPYGTVGDLPWYGNTHSIAFGADPEPQQLLDLAGQIKTFTEGTDPDSSDVLAIRTSIAKADIVLFLGFAYHRLNLELIQPPENIQTIQGKVLYLGTALGISSSDQHIITNDIRKLKRRESEEVDLRTIKCFQIFQECSRILSLS